MVIEMNSDIKMDANPSCSITKQNRRQKIEYDYAGYDVAIQSNPSCSPIYKDEDGYVKTNSLNMQKADYHKVTGSAIKEEESVYDVTPDDTDQVKINSNPSYHLVSGDVKVEDNPSYSKIKHT